MSIIIAFNPVNFKDEQCICRQNTAIEVLSMAPQGIIPLAIGFYGDSKNEFVESLGIKQINVLKRDSQKEIGNDRKLPYIKEIFDILCKIDCKKFGFINSDILIDKKVYNTIEKKSEACIFSRREIKPISTDQFINNQIEILSDEHGGADGFFFDREWWLNNRHLFHDNLICGETDWDNCYRDTIKKYSNNYIEDRSLYHVFHSAKWTTKSKGAINNIKIWMDMWEDNMEKK